MRQAKEYVSGYPFLKDSQMIIDIIRSAQIEAVNEAIEMCKKETELNFFIKGRYEGAKWIKLKDRKPEIEIDGEKLLIYRIMNPSQDSQPLSIFPTKMIHPCNSDETWWMPLPEKPIINQ